MELQSIALPTELLNLNHKSKVMAVSTGIEPAISCVTGRRVNRYTTRPNTEEEGFEPPRAVKLLSVFKTDPFSRTWVFLQNYMDLAGLEPATERL